MKNNRRFLLFWRVTEKEKYPKMVQWNLYSEQSERLAHITKAVKGIYNT